MQAITFVTLLLVCARTIAAEQAQVVSNSQPEYVPVNPVVGPKQAQHQPSAASGLVSVISNEPVGVSGVEHHVSHVEHVQPVQHGPQAVHQYSNYQVGGVPSYYSPAAGMIQVVSGQQEVGSVVNKPSVGGAVTNSVRHYASASALPVAGGAVAAEQYGQPESASIPANYKPFGSWGLYIGGNPADGYYTNYYRSLGSGVDKQAVGNVQVVPEQQQQVAPVKPVVGASSMLRQASGGPYFVSGVVPASAPVSVGEAHSYDSSYYTPAELNSGVSRFPSPFQAGSNNYGTPSASFEPSSPVLSYADMYSTKKLAGSQQAVQKENVQVQQQQQQSKGYQARSGYVYSVPNYYSPVGQPAGSQVVAYPVPVGSQIVGSQPGVEGSFYPYGVHAFTRYAVKPTVVGSGAEQQSAYYQPAFPSYKQQQQQYQVSQYQPMSFYGYPLSQLHYSPVGGKLSPSVVGQEQGQQFVGSPEPMVGHHSPVSIVPQPNETVAASEKSETSQEKSQQADKQQKRA